MTLPPNHSERAVEESVHHDDAPADPAPTATTPTPSGGHFAPPRRPGATSAGRGFLTMTVAKVWFVVTSYGIHFALPRILGTPEAFGRFSAALGVASILNNVLIASTLMTMSRFTGLCEEAHAQTLRRGLLFQLLVGGVLAALLFVAAPWLAGAVLQDDQLRPMLRLVPIVVAAYAVYAGYVGSLNGRRLFLAQARIDATFSSLRFFGILGGALLLPVWTNLPGETGAFAGFALAALGILLIAFGALGPGEAGGGPSMGAWFAFLGPIAVYQLFLNGTLLVDLLLLKGTLGSLALSHGASPEAAATFASEQVGIYSAAQKFAFVPYQLMLAMTFVLFPMVTKATAEGDREKTQRTLQQALRAAMLLLMLVAAPVSGAAAGLLSFVYPAPYIAGGPALAVLVFGTAGFALFVLTATAHSGAGKPWTAAAVALFGVVLVVALNLFAVAKVGVSGNVTFAAATATSISMFAALTMSAVLLQRNIGPVFSARCTLRTLLATGAGWSVARFLSGDGALWTFTALIAGSLSFVAALVVLREITGRDIAMLRRIVRR